MQFGWAALESIIQVSDHPVGPSFGEIDSTGTFSPLRKFVTDCQVVPTTVSPDVNDAVLLRVVGPVLADDRLLCLQRSTEAWNCSSSSSYGFVMLRSGCVAIRYTAASAM